MLSILGWLFIGLFIGSIAQCVLPSNESHDVDGPMVISLLGACIGGLLGGSPLRAGQGDMALVMSLVRAVLGCVAALGVYGYALRIDYAALWGKVSPLLRLDYAALLERVSSSKIPRKVRALTAGKI